MRLVCLHGFLGLPSDWDFLGPELKRLGSDVPVVALDLWQYVPKSFEQVAGEVAALLEPDDVLLGYSLGGRIATRSFFIDESCSRGRLVVVSAHYGGLEPSEVSDRIQRDETWAAKFESDDWDTLKRDWSSQPVFVGDGPTKLSRIEANFDRKALSHALRAWSVVSQPDSRPLLAACKRPVLWLAGELDAKYADITKELAHLSPNLHARVIKGAGHRLPWGSREDFVSELARFLSR